MTIATHDARHLEFTIGWRLHLTRKTRRPDLDVRAFADLIGVSKNTVTNYELEKTPPERMKPVVLNAWALATGVDPDWLRTGVIAQPKPPSIGGGSNLVFVGSAPRAGLEPATYGLRVRRAA